MLHAKASRIILAAAVIDDVLGLIVLAIASSMAQGEVNLFAVALTGALAIGFTILVAQWGTKAMSAIVPRLEHKLSAAEGQFAVAIGLRFDLSAFANASTLMFAVVILIAAVASKLIGCGLGAIRSGKADAIRIGIGMIPRGEVGMVVAQIGLAMAVISESLFGVVVFMSVMTTIIAPPLLNWAYRDVKALEAGDEQKYRIG